MALIGCPECGKEVSSAAPVCPQCGYPIASNPAGPASPRPPWPASQPPGPPPTDGTYAAPTYVSPPVAAPPKRSAVRWSTFVLLGILALAIYLVIQFRSGKSVSGALTGPSTIVSETVELEEGEAKCYGVTLPADRQVDVDIESSRKINIMLMDPQQWERYKDARQSLFGGKYEYNPALSAESVRRMKTSRVIPGGSWCLAIEHPRESVVFVEKARVRVLIKGY